MGGSNDTQQTTSTTQPSNPVVTATQNKLLGGLQGAYDSGIKVFNQSMYPGVGDTTRSNWQSTLDSYSPIARGERFGMDDPGFATLRNKVADDTTTQIYSDFNNSGLFGSDSNMKAAGEGLGNALAGLDYANFQNDQARQDRAVGMVGAVGAAQDADSLARRQAEADLFRRQSDPQWDALARASSILAGTSQGSGQTTTNTQPATPWWQQVLGYVAGNAGQAVRMM